MRSGEVFAQDEHPRATTLERLEALAPAFREGGSVTAGNSSGINDGAAALVLMRRSEAVRRDLAPRLALLAWAVTGIDLEYMGYAPAAAIPKALERAGLGVSDVDIVELNEAFAAQAVAVIRDVGLDEERVKRFAEGYGASRSHIHTSSPALTGRLRGRWSRAAMPLGDAKAP